MATERARPRRDQLIAELAERQHGRVALRQLKDLGLSATAVRDRVASGRLRPVHRGVYAVGHSVPSARGQWMAAVLACGEGAVVSHRSAAALWGLRPDSRTTTDVTARDRAGRRRRGIRCHSGATLRHHDTATVAGIPCTGVARTLLDLAGVLDRRGLERALDQAEVIRVLDARALEAVLARSPGRRGVPTLRSLLDAEGREPAPTRSELEEAFLALCERHALPRPLVNHWIGLEDSLGFTVDFCWSDRHLVVEADSYSFHRTRRALERDRERDRRLALAGWRSMRFTWRQVTTGAEGVAAAVEKLLGARAA